MSVVPQVQEKSIAVGRRALTMWLAPAVIILGTALRFLNIGTKSYWLDEVMMLNVAGGSLDSLLSAAGNGRPPVFVFMAHIWMQWFGNSEAVTRSLSAVFGSAALIFMYLVGKELLGRRAGLIATFVMAISEFQIDQSQNFRYYAVFIFFALVSFYAFWRALHTGKFGYWVVYVGATIATFYSHTHGVFLIAAQGVFFVLLFRRFRAAWLPWLASQVLIFLGIFPGLYVAFFGATGGKANVFQWVPTPKLYTPFLTLVKFILPGRHAPAVITLVGALIFGIVGALYVLYKSKDRWLQSVREFHAVIRSLTYRRDALILVVCWLVLPIVLPLIGSKVFGPMYLDRYVIGAAPALYLLMGLVMVSLRKVVPIMLPLGMLTVLIGPGLTEYYTTPTNEQWREASVYIHQNQQPGDRFIFAPGEDGAIQDSLDWYYKGDLPGCGIEAVARQPADIAQQLPACLGGANRYWLIIRGLPDRVEPYRSFFLTNPPSNMHLVQQEHLKDVDLYLFTVGSG